MRNSPILDALFPKVRANLLAAIFSQPDREWYLSELAKFVHTQPSSLQREVNALTEVGVLIQRREGRRVYLKSDRQSPVFHELKSFFDKTAGIVPTLQRELESLFPRMRIAFVYGSVARSQEISASDIDLMLMGDMNLLELLPALRRAEKQLGRPINPTIYSASEFQIKFHAKDHFLTTVLRGAKLFVKGSDLELDSLTQ